MQVLDSRLGSTFDAHFVQLDDDRFAVIIERPAIDGRVWEGAAVFPYALYYQAVERYQELEDDVDVEDILREWADPDGHTLINWIAFVQEADHEVGLSGAHDAEDLPELVIPPEGLLRKIKPKKAAAARAPKTPKAKQPYVPRQFPRPEDAHDSDVTLLPLDQYDQIIVSFSGGKDSIACVLHLLELGIPADRIELWHQCVDGRPGKDERVYDWPCTESYCEAFAHAFGMRLLYQWKEKGLLGEMTKVDRPTAPSSFQQPDGAITTTGGEGKPGTRLAFPAMAADLMTRWCSAYVKIDVAKKVFTNDPRFANSKSIILTGERREESGNRAKYADATDYSSTSKRTVHQWRPILSWFEQDVWEIMERYRVRPHPAYYLGWSRVSCFPCIFGDPNQWASIRSLTPKLFTRLAKLEDKFYVAARTIPNHPFAHDPNYNGYLRRGESLGEAADKGTPYLDPSSITPRVKQMIDLAFGESYPQGFLLVDKRTKWDLPRGAYGHSGGPT